MNFGYLNNDKLRQFTKYPTVLEPRKPNKKKSETQSNTFLPSYKKVKYEEILTELQIERLKKAGESALFLSKNATYSPEISSESVQPC